MKFEKLKKIFGCFTELTRLERAIWLSSLTVIISCYALSRSGDVLSLIASLIGVTALIFVAKGYVIGQILTVIFAVFYGIISFYFAYYGEMITYLGMSAPMAIMSAVSWAKNPYRGSSEVKIRRVSRKNVLLIFLMTGAVTALFYFILKALDTENLFFSTVSVSTSFLAVAFTFMRSHYYALAYAANDVVLIILWVLASLEDSSYIPMVVCFTVFLMNDIYGFVNWQRMKKRQLGT